MNKKNQVILFIGIAIAMLGYGIALPLFPFYIEAFGGGGIQLGLLVASYGVMQLIFAPFWGSLSDRLGRKPILMVGMFGLGCAMFLFGWASSLWMLYLAQAFSGALSSAMLPVSMAYVSDVNHDKNQSGAMGKIGAAVGLGMILGPGVGGLLAGGALSTPFIVSGVICIFTGLLMGVALPESLVASKRKQNLDKEDSFQIRNLYKALLSPMAFGFFTVFAVNFGKANFSSVYGLYALNRFDYGPQQVGSILMMMSFVYLVAQGFIVGPLTSKWGEKRVIKGALLGNGLGFLLMMAANNHITVVLSICCFILFNSLLKPSALSYIARNANVSQGMAMGMAESYMSIGRIIGPLWAGMLFDINMFYPFASGAIIFGSMFALSFVFSKQKISE